MNHPIIKKETLKLVINQLEKYNESLYTEIYFNEQADLPNEFLKEDLKSEIKINDSLLQELYQLYEIKY